MECYFKNAIKKIKPTLSLSRSHILTVYIQKKKVREKNSYKYSQMRCYALTFVMMAELKTWLVMQTAAPREMSYTVACYIAICSFAGAKGKAAYTHGSLQELAVVQHTLQRALCSPNLHSARGRPAAAGQTAGAVRQQVPRRLQLPGSAVSGRETLQPDPRPDVGHATLERQLLPVFAPVRDSVSET